MSQHEYYRPPWKLMTPGNGVLMAIMAIGFLAAVYRFIQGLGATTNLTDQYPWGMWVAFDVVCGVALAAGGFTTAAVVYVFWGEEYHGLVRPAVLTGFLGYVFVAVGLLVAALALIPFVGTEFLPELDEGAIAINVVRLPSASIHSGKVSGSPSSMRLSTSASVNGSSAPTR